MVPLLDGVNRTPSSTELVSAESAAPAGGVSGQIVHGHCPPTSNALLVVNVNVNGEAIVFPELSFAPLTVTVYVVPAASALDGVKVSTVSAPLNDVLPATALPPGPVTANDTLVVTTASENVTLGSVEVPLLDDPATGVALVTDGPVPATGVTALDGADAGPVPTALVAD